MRSGSPPGTGHWARRCGPFGPLWPATAPVRLVSAFRGKVRSKDAAIIAGIAERNAKPETAPVLPPTTAEAWGDSVVALLDETYGSDSDAALSAAIELLEGLTEESPPNLPPSSLTSTG